MFETVYLKRPSGDKLFKYLSYNLRTELDGYTRMAAFYDEGDFKGCAALKFTETYCGLDIFAPKARFTRKVIRMFFTTIFTVVPLCLCVVKNNNNKSLDFVTRLGFKVVKKLKQETLLSFTKTDFERGYYGKHSNL